MRPFVITLDIDWAPDFAILDAADLLEAHSVKSTWFVTHETPVLERLRARPDLFELGIHPNFLPNSSQGSTPEEVLDSCMRWVPEARSMRTHSLVQSTPLLRLALQRTRVRIDVSLFLPYSRHADPVVFRAQGDGLYRLPYIWEDDIEFEQEKPRWDLADIDDLGDEPAILDFHPMHLALNSPSMANYRGLLSEGASLRELERASVQRWIHPAAGSRTAFEAALRAMTSRPSLTIQELARASGFHLPAA